MRVARALVVVLMITGLIFTTFLLIVAELMLQPKEWPSPLAMDVAVVAVQQQQQISFHIQVGLQGVLLGAVHHIPVGPWDEDAGFGGTRP